MEITYATNFLRVFKVPNEFPKGYCFDGGHLVSFEIIDWFNAITPMDFQKVETVIEQSDDEYDKWVEVVRDFIKGKKYFNPTFTYMVMTDYGAVFIVNPEKRANELQKQHGAMVAKAKKEMVDEVI